MAVSISLAITQNSQSVANNTSNVTVSVTAKWTYGSWNATGECYGSITIDGTKHSFSGIKFNTGASTSGSQVIMTKTVNVSHNDDGKKTLNCSASFYTGLSSGTVKASGSKVLTTIPRKSSLSASNGTLGTELNLTVSKKAESFTHTITYKCGSASGTVCTKVSGTSVKWNTSNGNTLSLASQNTTGTSVSVTFTITTYSGSANVGSDTKTITMSIPASVKPSCVVSVGDVENYKNKYGAFVKGYSKFYISVMPTIAYGSSIASYKVTANDATYTKATIKTDALKSSGELTVSATVTDKRGRSSDTVSQKYTVLDYKPPVISGLTVQRCNADGSLNNQGTHIQVKFSGTVINLNNKNSALYQIQVKKSTEDEYTTYSQPTLNNVYSVTNYTYNFEADKNSSYDIIVSIKDDFKTTTKTASGTSIKKVWSLLKKGAEIVGFAIGKIAEFEGVFDVDMVIRARKGIIVDSEWVDLQIGSEFALYNGTAANQPKYKVTGNVVTVIGCVSPVKEFTSSTTAVTIASGIPEDLRPSTALQFICQGSGMNRWNCSINTNGTVGCARYGTNEATTVPTTAWLPFTITYQV